MTSALLGQMIVAEKVTFDDNLKNHSIEKIKNSVSVNVYPAVAIVDVWVKILILNEYNDKLYVRVIDPDQKVAWQNEPITIINKRPDHMPGGMDLSLQARIVVLKPGIHTFVLYDHLDNILSQYPVYIST